jgi:iron-sulfur cluster assembly accessory protein
MNMTFPDEITIKPVKLTQPAADAVRGVINQKNLLGYALRLYISGGGCSGFQYGLSLDSNIRPEDVITETDGIKLIIDEVSIKYVQGATVDYVEGMTSSGFKIINPNAVTSCNCGQSFNSAEGDTSGSCTGCG